MRWRRAGRRRRRHRCRDPGAVALDRHPGAAHPRGFLVVRAAGSRHRDPPGHRRAGRGAAGLRDAGAAENGAGRRGVGGSPAAIWPGFVDAMTAMILVLFFVLSIFMIVQFVLRDTITGQGPASSTSCRCRSRTSPTRWGCAGRPEALVRPSARRSAVDADRERDAAGAKDRGLRGSRWRACWPATPSSTRPA